MDRDIKGEMRQIAALLRQCLATGDPQCLAIFPYRELPVHWTSQEALVPHGKGFLFLKAASTDLNIGDVALKVGDREIGHLWHMYHVYLVPPRQCFGLVFHGNVAINKPGEFKIYGWQFDWPLKDD